MSMNTQLQQAYQLHNADKDHEALHLLYNIVQEDADALLAWQLILKIAKKQIVQINPPSETKLPSIEEDFEKQSFNDFYKIIQYDAENWLAWNGIEKISKNRIEVLNTHFKLSKELKIKSSRANNSVSSLSTIR